MVRAVSLHCFGVLASSLSASVAYHNIENRPASGICVANHTSPIDALVLMCDNCYSLVSKYFAFLLKVFFFFFVEEVSSCKTKKIVLCRV